MILIIIYYSTYSLLTLLGITTPTRLLESVPATHWSRSYLLISFVCVFLSFACQAQSRAQQNVAVECTCRDVCVGECVDARLRLCQDVQPGTELLLFDETVGKQQKPDSSTEQQTGNYRGHRTGGFSV